jgi:DNA repair exonuclease SbcCD ATPase subunit
MSNQYESLKKTYATLKEDHTAQQDILSGIRSEASNLLHEIKSLSNENQGLKDECLQYKNLVDDLKKETAGLERQRVQHQRQVDTLQSQVEHLKQQNRDLHEKFIAKTPVVYSRTNPNIDFQHDRIHETSAYKIDRIKPYILAVNQLLDETKRQNEPSTNVLVAMRSIVLACKTITEDCDSFETQNSLAPLDRDSIGKLKQQLSNSLTKLMQVAKECATTASDSSAKSLFESTCALTSVVVDLITSVNRIVDQTLANQLVAPIPKSSYNLQELKVFYTD